jgi:[acyl-carrier-protein] S-malonyltransferase
MHKPTAFLFPGQGSQAVGMGKELAAMYPVARQTFDEADEALGYKLSEVCFEGPEEKLRMTETTQPAILAMSIATCRVLREVGVEAQLCAGHSLGEYSAHVAAGTLDFADAVRTVRNRGQYMQQAVPVGVGAMAAILALPLAKIREICGSEAKGEVCEPANINSPDQVVISGNAAAVQRAADACKAAGAKRAVMLPVSAPFHCSLMQPAQDRLAADLQSLRFHDPQLPVVANIDAQPKRLRDDSREALVRQVTGAVRWEDCIRTLIAAGIENFIEVGPGKVLCGLMRQIDRSKTCFNVEDEASLQKLSNHLGLVREKEA